jgi:hypothetical protein
LLSFYHIHDDKTPVDALSKHCSLVKFLLILKSFLFWRG